MGEHGGSWEGRPSPSPHAGPLPFSLSLALPTHCSDLGLGEWGLGLPGPGPFPCRDLPRASCFLGSPHWDLPLWGTGRDPGLGEDGLPHSLPLEGKWLAWDHLQLHGALASLLTSLGIMG